MGGDVGTPTPRGGLGLARSSSGVWWKLVDGDASEVERRLRGIAEEEAAVRARMERRHAVRRRIAVTSMSLEVVALVHGLWKATRRGFSSSKLKLIKLLLPAVAIPALATLVLAALARFRRSLDARDQQHLDRLRTERNAKIGGFRGSHHNLQKLIEKYDPDGGGDGSSSNDAATRKKQQQLKRTHSRLSFHVDVGEAGDE
ncbi:hypothetical protein PAHAL_1G459800 [Panicum hallii]|uniref:Uncharacterized protein n=1 Tax=Panicum hallii TaxID=206008 RepID=A0A2S3GUV4_9POAL|nr:uncharacterized protein At2g24330-like [Panicum hallii]PAN09114.1 hypothetical protein PAHAL_1G459800 [Panicum hallii]